MRVSFSTRYRRITNLSLAIVLTVSSVAALVPFVFSQRAAALATTVTVCTSGCDYSTLQAAIDAVDDGSTLELKSDLTTTSETVIDKPLTLRGLGHTITPNYDFVSNASDNSVIEIIGTTGVTINNVTIDGANRDRLHGINIYEATASINNTVSKNNYKSGVVVNRSNVTLAGISTENNGWHGVNLDTTNVAIPSTLTIKQWATHGEPISVYVDDTTKPVTFIDQHNLYVSKDNVLKANDRVYRLTPQAPSNVQFYRDSNNAVIPAGSVVDYTNITMKWQTVPGAERYQINITDPTGDTLTRYTGWYTFDLTDPVRQGFFGDEEGVYTYNIRTKDAITGAWSTWDTYTMIYGVKPNVTIDTLTSGQFVAPTFTVEGTAIDAMSDIDRIEYTVNKITAVGGVYVSGAASGTATGTTDYEFTVSGLDSGVYRVKVQAFDTAGNWRHKYVDVVVDATAPTVTLDTVSEVIDGVTTFSGTAADADSGLRNGQIRLVFRPIVGGILQAPERVYFVPVQIDGTWTVDVDTEADLTDGQLYRVVARANDAVGHNYATSNTAAERAETTVDNTPDVLGETTGTPIPTVSETPSSSENSGNTGSSGGSGTASQTQTPTPTPTITSPTAFVATTTGESSTTDGEPTGEQGVEGASTETFGQATQLDTTGDEQGLAWYWWLLIIGGAITLISIIVAAVRGRAANA